MDQHVTAPLGLLEIVAKFAHCHILELVGGRNAATSASATPRVTGAGVRLAAKVRGNLPIHLDADVVEVFGGSSQMRV